MIGEVLAVPLSVWFLPHNKCGSLNNSISISTSSNQIPRTRTHFPDTIKIPPSNFPLQKFTPVRLLSSSTKAASSSGNTEYAQEPATNVKFQTTLSLPGCSSSLSLIGTGFREKVFAIIGVKVYAAGLYVNPRVLDNLDAWKGRTAAEIHEDSSLFDLIYQAPLEKSLQIVLVRDVDGKTFWDALDEAISPRIKSPNSVDKTALSTFRGIFQDRSLKKGTFIFLTWLQPSKMLVNVYLGHVIHFGLTKATRFSKCLKKGNCGISTLQIHISAEGIPSAVEAAIESENVPLSLFDVFFGCAPVSPSLKASISNGLASSLK